MLGIQCLESLELDSEVGALRCDCLVEERLAEPEELFVEPVVRSDPAHSGCGNPGASRTSLAYQDGEVVEVSPVEHSFQHYEGLIKSVCHTNNREVLHQIVLCPG